MPSEPLPATDEAAAQLQVIINDAAAVFDSVVDEIVTLEKEQGDFSSLDFLQDDLIEFMLIDLANVYITAKRHAVKLILMANQQQHLGMIKTPDDDDPQIGPHSFIKKGGDKK